MAAAKAKDSKDEIKFEDKQKALDAALSQIEKQFGKGAVMKLGRQRKNERGSGSHRLLESGYRFGRGRCA